ncbi:MAG: flagellar filament capping protein FliD [Campylobacterales bacterium]
MATGSVSMLGISAGGQSSLNADLIDNLKEADKAVMIKPLETRLTKVYKQQEDQQKLTEKLDAFRDAVDVFSSSQSYMKRTVQTNHDSVTVTAQDGVSVQDLSLRVDKLARNSVAQSEKGYAQESTIIYSGVEPRTLSITQPSGKELEISITGGMTLSDVRDAINEAGGGKVIATLLNTGGEAPYRLVVKSADTGANQELSFAVKGEGEPVDLSFSSVQSAQDAEFVYNGVTITRATNKVSDLVSGVTIELRKEDSIDVSASITRDLSELGEQMASFVEVYNDLTAFINEITKYDVDSAEAGSFQGDARINGIKTELSRILFGQDSEGNNLMQLSRTRYTIDGTTEAAFAFSLSEKGVLSFDKTTFEYALEQDPEGIERFLRGSIDVTPSEAVGSKIASTIPGESAFETVTISAGQIKINGVGLSEITFPSGNTAKQNALLAMEAINAVKDQTGVEARLSSTGDRLVLSDKSGNGFTISGNESSRLGLTNGSYVGQQESFDGLFTRLSDLGDKLAGYQEDATMTLIGQNLKSQVTGITDNIQKVLDRLNAKYDVMAAQFAAYNSLISRYEASFSSIQMQIDQAAAKK